jgi:hypothetical protein
VTERQVSIMANEMDEIYDVTSDHGPEAIGFVFLSSVVDKTHRCNGYDISSLRRLEKEREGTGHSLKNCPISRHNKSH